MKPSRGFSVVSYPAPNTVVFTNTFIPGPDATTTTAGDLPNVLALDSRDLGLNVRGRVVIFAHTGDSTSQVDFCGPDITHIMCNPDTTLDNNWQLVRNVMRWLYQQ